MVHTDVCDFIEISYIGKARYSVTFIDDHFSCVIVSRIQLKSKAREGFLYYERLAEQQTDGLIRTVWSNGRGEYLNNNMRNYFSARDIEHHLTTAY